MLIAIIAAAIFSLGFYFNSLWFLAYLAIAYLLIKPMRTRDYLIFGFVCSLLILSFVRVYVGDLPWLALAILQTIPFAIFGPAKRFPLLVRALLWGGVEYLQAHLFFHGFGFIRLGYLLPPLFYRQIRIYGGFSTALLVLSLMILLLARMKYLPFLPVLALLIPVVSSSNPTLGPTVSVKIVQGGVGATSTTYQALLDANTSEKESTLFFLPENVLHPGDRSLKIGATSNYFVGAVIDVSNRQNLRNVIIDKSQAILYVKRHLTPFGEYLPFPKFLRLLNSHAKEVVDFLPGDRVMSISQNGLKVLPLICFDIFDDSVVASQTKQPGNSIIYVASNSQTFYGTSEGRYENRVSRMIAMESGRYLIYSSTTGPSSIFAPTGESIVSLVPGIPVVGGATIRALGLPA